MLDELDKIIADLANPDAGWVVRRDAAEALGEIGKKSLDALNARADEKDVDVRSAAERARARISGAIPSAAASAPAARPGPPTMKELAAACAKKSVRGIKAEGDGFIVRVKLKEDRMQYVRVARHAREDGLELLRASTECGPADDERIAWAIKRNSQFIYGAFCLEERDGANHLRIAAQFDMRHVTPAMVKDAVKEMAFYGDWLERKLTNGDTH